MIEVQHAALGHVRERARQAEPEALRKLAKLLGSSDLAPAALIDSVRRRMAVTVNFHPDRLAFDGRSVIDHLLVDGVYRSQFETGISNGGLTAFDGGDRDRWEHGFFGGAYQDAPAGVRPKYGALDVIGLANGGAPRFGSCHLRLSADASSRATFSFGDSVSQPAVWGTRDVLAPVVVEMLGDVAAGRGLLGHRCDDVAEAVQRLHGSGVEFDPASAPLNRELDAYVEAQFHDDLDLARDVDAMVVDGSFIGTHIDDSIIELARRHGVDVRYSRAFRVAATDVPAELRGPEATSLAIRLAAEFGDGQTIDASVLGRSAVAVVLEPDLWPRGDSANLLQQIKYLWHVLVLLG